MAQSAARKYDHVVSALRRAGTVPWLTNGDVWETTSSGRVPKLMQGVFLVSVAAEDRLASGNRAVYRTNPFWSRVDQHPHFYFYTARKEETLVKHEGVEYTLCIRCFKLKQRSGSSAATAAPPVVRELYWLKETITAESSELGHVAALVIQRMPLSRNQTAERGGRLDFNAEDSTRVIQLDPSMPREPIPYFTFCLRYLWNKSEPPSPQWLALWSRTCVASLWECERNLQLLILHIVFTRLLSSTQFCSNLHQFLLADGTMHVPVTDALSNPGTMWSVGGQATAVFERMRVQLERMRYVKLDMPLPYLHMNIGAAPSLGVVTLPLWTGVTGSMEGQLDIYGVLHGWGKWSSPSLEYEGAFLHGVPHGNGRLRHSKNGKTTSIYQGGFDSSFPHGPGRLESFDHLGNPVAAMEGVWMHGVLLQPGGTALVPSSAEPLAASETALTAPGVAPSTHAAVSQVDWAHSPATPTPTSSTSTICEVVKKRSASQIDN